MNFILPVIWLLKALLLVGGGGALLLAPEWVAPRLGLPDKGFLPETLRLTGSALLAWGTLVGGSAIPALRWARREAAWRFGWLLATWAATLEYFGTKAWPDSDRIHIITVALAGVAMLHLVLATRPSYTRDRLQLFSRASEAEAHLGIMWFIQGLLWLASGVAGLIWPHQVLAALTTCPIDPQVLAALRTSLIDPQAPEVLRLGSLALIGLGCTSLGAIGPQTPASWRWLANMFIISQTALTVALLLVVDPRQFRPVPLFFAIAFVVMAQAAVATRISPKWLADFVLLLRRHIQLIWFFQSLVILSGGLLWLIWPETAFRLLLKLEPSDLKGILEKHPFGVDMLESFGHLTFGMALLTLVARMRQEPGVNVMHARIFSIFMGTWSIIVLYNQTGGFGQRESRFSVATMVFVAPAMILLTCNLLVSLFYDSSVWGNLYKGTADTKPNWLWRLWGLQGFYLLLLALGQSLFAETVSEWVLRPNQVKPESFEIDQMRMAAPYYLGMAVLSFSSMRIPQNWLWRQIAGVFFLWQTTWFITFIWGYERTRYHSFLLVHGLIIIALALANAWAWRLPVLADDSSLEESPQGALTRDQPALLPMLVQMVTRRKRASHLVGVGATGTFHVQVPGLTDNTFPHNDFFHSQHGKRLPVTVRFANVTYTDDAALDVRGASIRLTTLSGTETFDMVFNTGSFSAPRNLLEFTYLVLSKWASPSMSRAALLANRQFREGGVAGLRRAPDSYSHLFYYSQIVRTWVGTTHPLSSVEDSGPEPLARFLEKRLETERNSHLLGLQKLYLVRYRLLPLALVREPYRQLAPEQLKYEMLESESGLPDAQDTATLWERQRRPQERRAPDYLRRELKDKLNSESRVRFQLQAQFYPASAPGLYTGEALAWYNGGVDWDEAQCPWRDLGTLELTSPLPEDKTERLWFNPAQHPLSMGIPGAASLTDYRSLGDSEARVMRILQLIRLKKSVEPDGDTTGSN